MSLQDWQSESPDTKLQAQRPVEANHVPHKFMNSAYRACRPTPLPLSILLALSTAISPAVRNHHRPQIVAHTTETTPLRSAATAIGNMPTAILVILTR
jgi:hypothetical protein